LSNPYLLDTPAVVSFSGGRTSGYMLWHIIQAFGGTLPDGVKVVFCNTGKERPETLAFVERCSQRWGVAVTWLEYRHDGKPTFAVVDFATASRDGEPLATAITARRGDSGFLPNPMVRYCTIDTKIKTTVRYLKSLGWERWTNAVGFRADEPRRVAKLNGRGRCKREDGVAPLAVTGVTREDVMGWWRRQPFDLGLSQDDGNCDLCFLKGRKAIIRAIQREPWRADWWIGQEDRGGRFRNDRPTYRKMLAMAQEPTLFDGADDTDLLSASCHCTD
jgi:3'-phosphoadenosine 5'-phosphosulfate sulfotransferase (PAPS reductase)/FAD synthetase